MNTIFRLLSGVLRPLARKPGFAVAVIVILALGIGINVATLGLLYRYYVAPLPYPQGSRLVKVYFSAPGATAGQLMSVSTWWSLQRAAPALAASGIYDEQGYNLEFGSHTTRLNGIEASASLFNTLGVRPLLGRVFGMESTEPGAQPVVVLSYRLWQTLFDGKPSALGQTLQLGGKPYTVIGVMPRGFNFPTSQASLWTPQLLTADEREHGNPISLGDQMVGRLAPGASLTSLGTQANAVFQRQISQLPVEVAALIKKLGVRVDVQSWRATQTANLHQSLILVLCATLLLMLLVWFNLANLFLTRSLARRGELAMRRVLGAGSGRLVLSMAGENLILSVLGAAGGIVLGRFLLDIFSGSAAAVSASAIGNASWATLIVIAVVLALISTSLFTVMGLGALRDNNLAAALRGADARVSSGLGTRRVRAGLIAGQIALACTIVGTGLLLGRGLLNLNAVRLGFNPVHVVTFQLNLPKTQYSLTQMTAVLSELHTAVARLPGIEVATLAGNIPFDGSADVNIVLPLPWDPSVHPKPPTAFTTAIDANYLHTLGMQLVAGRNFLPSDTASSASVALIDTLEAKQLFGTENVIGREIDFNQPSDTQPGATFRIIGVVNAVHLWNLDFTPTEGSIYTDFNQVVAQNPQLWGKRDWYFAVRSPLAATTVISEVRNVAHGIIPGVPLYDVQTMDQRVAASLASNRLLTVLVLLFAIGALVLAAVGLYALQAYSVAQRSREFAIRTALGASQSRVIAQVLGETARLLVIGLVVGLAGLAAVGVAFASAFYGIGAVDPAGMVIVVIVLALAALAASWIPAWRASRVSPMEALRER